MFDREKDPPLGGDLSEWPLIRNVLEFLVLFFLIGVIVGLWATVFFWP